MNANLHLIKGATLNAPNWSPLFPAASQPAGLGSSHLFKVMILMSDGAFNMVYCKGVISGAASATDRSSGRLADHSACAAPSGDSFAQVQNLCTAMQAAPNKIII